MTNKSENFLYFGDPDLCDSEDVRNDYDKPIFVKRKGIFVGKLSSRINTTKNNIDLTNLELTNTSRIDFNQSITTSRPSTAHQKSKITIKEDPYSKKSYCYRQVGASRKKIIDAEIINIRSASRENLNKTTILQYMTNIGKGLNHVREKSPKCLNGPNIVFKDEIDEHEVQTYRRTALDTVRRLRKYKFGSTNKPPDKPPCLEDTHLSASNIESALATSPLDIEKKTDNPILSPSALSRRRSSMMSHAPQNIPPHPSPQNKRNIVVIKRDNFQLYQVMNPPPTSPQSANAGSKKGDPLYSPSKFRVISSETKHNTNSKGLYRESDDQDTDDHTEDSENIELFTPELNPQSYHDNTLKPSCTRKTTTLNSSSSDGEGKGGAAVPCSGCSSVGLLWCPQCALAFCFYCWIAEPHHSEEAAMAVLSNNNSLPNPIPNPNPKQMNSVPSIDTSKHVPSMVTDGQAKAVVYYPDKTIRKYRDYHKNPVYVDGTGFIHEARPETLTKLLHTHVHVLAAPRPKYLPDDEDENEPDNERGEVKNINTCSTVGTLRNGLIQRGNLISTFGHEFIKTAEDPNELRVDAITVRNVPAVEDDGEGEDNLTSTHRSKLLRDKLDKISQDMKEEDARARRLAKLMKYLSLRKINDDDSEVIAELTKSEPAPVRFASVTRKDITVPDSSGKAAYKFRNMCMSNYNGKIVYTTPGPGSSHM